jgi:DNA invertase Pin-like site-specific DNA recombinase
MNLQTALSSIKIQRQHLERIAIVYVRQSTIQQMERHQESTKLQYALKDYAERLGWSKHRILIIDSDLGLSGATSEGRPGFQQLVSEVGLNHVGLVLGIEMSRLARSCKDWHQLLEVCAIFDTLIGDADGIYNPSQHNDRLLLGLKGTMSEAELHTIKSRMLEGKRSKAKRGELGKAVPIGYVRHLSREVRKDPDEQAKGTVELLFNLFEKIGTIQGVLRYLVKNKIEVPFRSPTGLDKGDLKWRRPNRATLRDFFHNPIYAGAYVYGRRPVDVRKKKSGKRSTGRVTVSPNEWRVLIKDKLPAYITWEQYERNLKQIEANRLNNLGAIRKGPSLLAGLLICGQCGRRMTTHYANNGFELRYCCTLEKSLYGGKLCQSLKGKPLDEFISLLILEAMKPAALEISMKVAEDIEAERKQLESHWRKRLERAHYETEKSRRQYNAVDPENRLVARTLEKEWEEKLIAEETLKNDYNRFLSEQPALLSSDEKNAISQLASDIPKIWNASTTSDCDKQAITRQMIEKIVLTIPSKAELVQLQVHWIGGHKTEHEFIRTVAKLEQMHRFKELEEQIRTLYEQGKSCRTIAEALNKDGWHLPRGGRFNEGDVRKFLVRRGFATARTYKGEKNLNEWTIFELAQKLETTQNVLYGWLRKGNILKSRKISPRNWLIYADEEELSRLRVLKGKLVTKYQQFNL